MSETAENQASSPPPGASAGREEPRGDPNCDDHDGFGPNGECSRCTGLIQKDNGALIDHYGNVVRTVTYSADFISREFARYQQSGCRDQSIRDNMPFFVESLLSALAAERAAGEALRTAALDCANDLEAEVRARYGWPDIHPAQQRKFDNDMQPVHTARALAADRETADGQFVAHARSDVPWLLARCQALEAALGEIVDLSDRQVSPYRPLIALAEIYARRLDAIRSIARRALAAGGECE